MLRIKAKGNDLSKFLKIWDKEVYELNVELRKIYLKQKKEQLVIQKKEELVFLSNLNYPCYCSI